MQDQGGEGRLPIAENLRSSRGIQSFFDDPMNMENENIQNSHHKVSSTLECLEM